MQKSFTWMSWLAPWLFLSILSPTAVSPDALAKLDPLAAQRSLQPLGQSRIIVSAVDSASGADVVSIVQQVGGSVSRALPILHAWTAEVPNASLVLLAANPLIARVTLDRVVAGAMERTGATVGATAIRSQFGYDGAGIGVAVIDSGVTAWHDDLAGGGGGQRVAAFVDLVGGRGSPYDDYGHGTHVAGIIAGNGFDSSGARSCIAPASHLVVLKALDVSGRGRISDVIAALDYVVAHRHDFNIRVVNLSVATGVYESYTSDPLTLAAHRAVAAGIVVVAASGNNGRDSRGRTQYGGTTAPGNAPWVLTVGASSHMGTVNREDDTMAAFSSRGPAAVDYAAKPDLVAPGVGIESLSDPESAFYRTRSAYLLRGTVETAYLPYLSSSGTSMAAPVVAGTVALMIQANPQLTPNQVKAILQYTAQVYGGYDPLTQGAGFLNAKGAVKLARHFAAPSTTAYPSSNAWSRRLIWGNFLIAGGRLTADANAWATDVTWGASTATGGQSVEWGVICATTTCEDGAWRAWRDGDRSDNVVWGSACGGADCRGRWTPTASGGAVSGASDGDTVVWGTSDGDTVVWGTSCSDPQCQPVIWNQP